MEDHRITNLKAGVEPCDAVNKKQLDTAILCLEQSIDDALECIKMPQHEFMCHMEEMKCKKQHSHKKPALCHMEEMKCKKKQCIENKADWFTFGYK